MSGDSDVEPELSVVLPTLNEEEGVARCIQTIKDTIVELGVPTEIVVSDSSTDRTPEIAADLGARVVEPDGEGYGYAYRYAFERVSGDYVAMGDADCTYDFSSIPRLLAEVRDSDADMALGSRLEGEIEDGAMPALHQYVGNPLLTRFLNVFYDAGVSDAHSGFRVFEREVLEELDLSADGMEFASEMVMDASVKGLDIAEVPITYHEREGDATLDSFRDGWRHVRFMLVNAPSYLFTLPAVVFAILGGVALLLSLGRTQVAGVTFGVQTAIAGSLLSIVGFNVGSLSVFTAVAADPIKKPADPLVEWITERFRLEHGITTGVLVALLGAAYVLVAVDQLLSGNGNRIPPVAWNMVAFTALVVGVQLVFQSFFLSILATER